MTDPQIAARFRRIGSITIISVYCIILIGGIVRASGAGMGCPDWPTCFGRWVPPTSEAQLPADYHSIYAERGYANTEFNAVKTWTEYMNRLAGVSCGFLVMLTVWYSRSYLKSDKAVFYLTFSVFLIIGFQGWLGSQVVASNLHPYMITLHMLLALTIVALLIYTIARSQKQSLQLTDCSGLPKRFSSVLCIAMGLTLLQVAMGVQVREAVDIIANQHSYIKREFWRNDFPLIFYVHRSFSSIILFTNLWLAWQVYRAKNRDALLFRSAKFLSASVVFAILMGVTMDRLAMPAFAQPLHLLMANIIFGLQFFIYICVHYAARSQSIEHSH